MVKAFDVRDRNHYVYTVADPAPLQKMRDERREPMIVGTGRDLSELLFPGDALTLRMTATRSYLWAVVAGKRFQVKHDRTPLVLFGGGFVLSPDGASLVTTLPVSDVPPSWETLYPPPFASYSVRIHAGHQDVQSGGRLAKQYVRIDLKTGSVRSLTDAPTSNDAGWWAGGTPSWSSDSKEIVLPGTFIQSKDQVPSRPCVAVVDVSSDTRACVEMLKRVTETGYEEGYRSITDTRFVNGDGQRVAVAFVNHEDHSYRTTEYRRTSAGTWQVSGESKGEPKVEHNGLEVSVKQWFNEPPLLVARSNQTSRVLWDPNPQLKNLDFGQASIYTWKDKEGRELRAGLFKPSDYKPRRRYPLVIQTHGFAESDFRPSGVFPTAMAARALAAAGIMVLQTGKVGECTDSDTPDEGPCKASGLEAVANQLVSEGLVDPERIGVIGFSATCHMVMEALTTKSFLRAASITDGVMADYFQYVIAVAMRNGETFTSIYNSLTGAPPFGDGLQQWLKRSPGFNLDKVNTPLMVVGLGHWSLLTMLEPYAGLHYLHKPVDLIMLNTNEHVLTNPAVRMASQGGSVDWFRFWLQDYEDPDPAKAEQYKRWRELRKLQEGNEKKSVAPPN